MVSYQTPIIAEKELSHFSDVNSYHGNRTVYFGFSCSYLKNELVDPIVNRGTGYETLKPSKARSMLSPTIIKICLKF